MSIILPMYTYYIKGRYHTIKVDLKNKLHVITLSIQWKMKAIYSIILKAKTILQGNFQLIFEIEIYFTNSYTFFFQFAKYLEYLSGRTTTTYTHIPANFFGSTRCSNKVYRWKARNRFDSFRRKCIRKKLH